MLKCKKLFEIFHINRQSLWCYEHTNNTLWKDKRHSYAREAFGRYTCICSKRSFDFFHSCFFNKGTKIYFGNPCLFGSYRLKLLTRFKTILSHLFLMNMSTNKTSPICNTKKENLEHLLLGCPSLEQKRSQTVSGISFLTL